MGEVLKSLIFVTWTVIRIFVLGRREGEVHPQVRGTARAPDPPPALVLSPLDPEVAWRSPPTGGCNIPPSVPFACDR
ncbi:MAG TPA: hypothetical protein VMF30_07840 [Pirellulales bacterium]|nr:hypothetical protein [Pirellulales bacterium]